MMQVSSATNMRSSSRDPVEDPPMRPTRIMLAEDDADLRRVLAMALRREGYDVVEARDGNHLRSYLGALLYNKHRADPVDLVITDVRMPGPSGVEMLEWLRGVVWSIPVIVITAFGDPVLHAEARRLGALAVLDKPFDVNELLALVRHNAPLD